MSAQANDIIKQFSRLKRTVPFGDVFLDADLTRLAGGDLISFDASAYVDPPPGSRQLGKVFKSGGQDSAAEAVDALIAKLPSKVELFIERKRLTS